MECKKGGAGMDAKCAEEPSAGRIACFAPVADARSIVLVLGTAPSVRSLAQGFYYAHPRNAFWPILCALSGRQAASAQEQRALALQMGVALWDSLASCERTGSLDSAIRHPQPNDIAGFVQKHPHVRAVLLNGGAAATLYRRHCAHIALPAVALPSTSPANTMPFARKLALWRETLALYGVKIKEFS